MAHSVFFVSAIRYTCMSSILRGFPIPSTDHSGITFFDLWTKKSDGVLVYNPF